MNAFRKIIFNSVLCAIFAGSLACSRSAPGPQSEFVLGTVCTINLFEKGKPDLYRELFARLREIEDHMSANKDGTDVDMINRNAGIAPVRVHDDVLQVIEKALYYARLTDGAFDPTVGPLVSLWGIGFEHPRVPAEAEIRDALSLVDWREIAVDFAAKTVYLPRKGMRLDLGAIAKGYAADEVKRIIRGAAVNRAIIDLGGNVLAVGTKAPGVPWKIGIQNPSGMRGESLGIMDVSGKTLVTSGIYERFFEQDGKRYHHILSTENGYPVDNHLLSVTVVADTSIDGDALSTSLFALGYEKGLALAESLPGVDALFVLDDLSVRGSPGLLKNFTLTDTRYHIAE